MSNFRAVNVFVKTQMHSFIALVKEKRILLYILLAAVVVITLFLYEAEPYSISRWQDQLKVLKLSGYGFIYVGTIYLCLFLIPQDVLYPVKLNVKVLSLISGLFCSFTMLVGFINWFYTIYVYDEYQATVVDLFKSIRHVFSSSSILFLFYMVQLLHRNRKYRLKLVAQNNDGVVTFDKFSVVYTDIMLIKSDGNYIFLYYMLKNQPKKIQLRYKISDAEKHLSKYNQFVRARRSYLINMNYISKEDLDINSTAFKLKDVD